MGQIGSASTQSSLNRKLWLRIMPFLVVSFVAAYIDRANVAFAALQMNARFGFAPTVYGWGAGIFFIGYTLVEIPSNMILFRVGPRRWIARIMITWGLVSALNAFVWDANSFYAVRFLLGVAEAGFVPGVMLYLATWFPNGLRGQAVGVFECGGPIATVIAGPISGWILSRHGLFGVASWQSLFLLEAILPILMGLLVLWRLPDTPQTAPWLSADERSLLLCQLHGETPDLQGHILSSFGAVFRSPRLILLSISYFGIICGSYAVLLWLPQIVTSFGVSVMQTGWLITLPYLLSVVTIILWTRHSDRTGERTWHVALPCFVAALCLGIGYWAQVPWVAFLGLCVAAGANWAAVCTFWTLPAAILSGSAAAGGLAMINSIGNVGGFVGPFAVGYIRQATGSFGAGLGFLAICILISGLLALAAARVRVGRAAPRLLARDPGQTVLNP